MVVSSCALCVRGSICVCASERVSEIVIVWCVHRHTLLDACSVFASMENDGCQKQWRMMVVKNISGFVFIF